MPIFEAPYMPSEAWHATLDLALDENRNQSRINKGEKRRLIFGGALAGPTRMNPSAWRDLSNMRITEHSLGVRNYSKISDPDPDAFAGNSDLVAERHIAEITLKDL